MRPINPVSKTFAELKQFLSIDSEVGGEFTGLTSNTQFLQSGDLFIALPGKNFHGASFIPDVVSAGAVAVLTDRAGAELVGDALPVLVHPDPRAIAADAASWFYNRPFSSMFSVGITGTNGKTTTASLLAQLWSFQLREVGMIGTIGVSVGNDLYSTTFTTPEGTELQAIAAMMSERCLTHTVIEVSSHALVNQRMCGSHFNVVAFTNLTQDHLDFHGTMAKYFSAKSALFTSEYAERALVNIDDPWGKKLYETCTIPVESVSREDRSAQWHYTEIHAVKEGYEVAIRGAGGILIEGKVPLIGLHNLDNTLMAVALGVESGLDPLAVGRDLAKLVGAPGRLECVGLGQDFLALVDFAHTPDAVIRVLSAVREITSGRVIALLGCGGDRDATKRPLMGDALVAGSDIAIFTSDNPRSEDPQDILIAMLNGKTESERIVIESNRRGAIAIAVSEAVAGDVVILLGKGHESGQEINGVKEIFDDRLELARAIERLT